MRYFTRPRCDRHATPMNGWANFWTQESWYKAVSNGNVSVSVSAIGDLDTRTERRHWKAKHSQSTKNPKGIVQCLLKVILIIAVRRENR